MALDAFLKLDGITGESIVRGHVGEIELDSFSFGLTNTGHEDDGGERRAVFQDFHFTSKVGKHSPQLFLACAKGGVIRSGVLTLGSVKSGQDKGPPPGLVPALTIAFDNVSITEYKVMDIASLKLEDAVSPEGGLITSGPEDSASFSFSRVEVSSGGAAATVSSR